MVTDRLTPRKILVRGDRRRPMLERKAYLLLAHRAGGEGFTLPQRGFMCVTMAVVVDPVDARGRNPLEWLVGLPSHATLLWSDMPVS